MALVERNGNIYYYSKKKVAGRVVTTYEGAGVVAELAAYRAEREREERERRIEEARERELGLLTPMAEIDRQIEQLSSVIDLLAKALLIEEGYHQHKRQWRKRRVEKQER